jgi:hypothetical protein
LLWNWTFKESFDGVEVVFKIAAAILTMTSIQSNEDEQKSGNPIGLASSAAKAHAMSLSALGDACGVAFLLGNHAKFGLAERCW